MKTTKFYTFRQNNSGRSFIESEKEGIGVIVIIEAESSEKANERAKDIGIYFDGCESGNDCPCCGDRWYEVSKYDGEEIPSIYGESIESLKKEWCSKDCFVHYLDGTFKKVVFKEEV